MRNVTLTDIFQQPSAQKYLNRSGVVHAIATAYHALLFAKEYGVDPDLATKAALLHDVGHYTWYTNGQWDYSLYKENDIHAIKGAERAHKLLIRLGEDPRKAKEIALAILLHTDSYLPKGQLDLLPLQRVVALADEADEEPGGMHHYRSLDMKTALSRIKKLDRLVDAQYETENLKHSV
ncbi:HD domain-containing protein [Fictibacillus enclensis]|uniref:HD domain-containing protein n=1 Tax=Fictibacillus enclensis TaxID=1017270 RepID=UPI0025A131BD|nr:HD domain-containing protein [Fictibacillus enclensis]MDM5337826.1 HD domain-containing protein [Fictibacillus enclensis]